MLKTWDDGFAYCASNDVVPFDDYTGRLARIDTEELWTDITTTTFYNGGFWTGIVYSYYPYTFTFLTHTFKGSMLS